MKQKSPDRVDELKALGVVISGKRKEAIEARKTSGIEKIWLACEEAYLGIDDANRHEFKDANWAKPTSMAGGLVADETRIDETKSTAFVRLTSRYVDVGHAKLSEILLPPGERAFSFAPTPIPDLVDSEKDDRPAVVNGAPIAAPMPPAPVPGQAPTAPSGLPMAAAAPMPGQSSMPGIAAPVTAPAPPPLLKISDLYVKVWQEAKEAAEAAEKRIYDWMVECKYHAENRKVIADSARLGVGVLKGPFPARKKVQAVTRVNGVVKLESKDKIRPAAKWIDPWNFFPDGACGEDIHAGSFCFERDYLTQGKLEDLKANKTYIADQIDKVIKEGPNKENEESPNPNEKKTKGRFDIWYFYGRLTRKEMLAANCELADGAKKDFYAIVTMVNDSVIRATINPLDSGKFPFNAMPWTRRAGSWAGVGIAEQVSMPQRVANASMRGLLNNAGLSGGVQIVMDRDAIEPAVANDWRIVPNKIWLKVPGVTVDDMRKAFVMLEYPNVGPQMTAILELAQRQAEDASNIPLISQGQSGPMTPETLGQTEIQNTNANTLLRSVGYSYDDHITEPIVNGFYEWLLLDPDVPDSEKGDFEIDAHGSLALVERAIQERTLSQMGEMVMNPAFGVDPKKWFAEWMKSKRLSPEKMQFSKEEQEEMAKTPPPDPVPVTVAKINTASAEKIAGISPDGQPQAPGQPETPDTSTIDAAQIRANTELQKTNAKIADAQADRDFDAAEAQKVRDYQLEMKRLDLQMKEMDRDASLQVRQMELGAADKQNLDSAKVKLAETTITDQTKREVAQQEIDLAREIEAAGNAAESPSLIRDDFSTPGTP